MIGWTYTPNALTVAQKSLAIFAPTQIQLACFRAWRYYDGSAYLHNNMGGGAYAFQDWDQNLYGRRPPVCPIPKRITEISAQSLFSEHPHIQIGDPKDTSDDSLQKFLDDTILRPNHFYANLLPEARSCSIEGATEYKWCWMPDDRKRPVVLQTFHPYDVTYFRDDLYADKIEMVRLQFKFVDRDGQWWWYREEWDCERVTYFKRMPTNATDDSEMVRHMDAAGKWPVESKEANRFGVIPYQKIFNRQVKGVWDGYGDYWEPNFYHLFDIYNHKVWQEHFNDQLSSNPDTFLIDLDFAGRRVPGEWYRLTGLGEHPGVVRPGTENKGREYLSASKQDVSKLCFDGVGYDDINPEVITNKGNLTRAVKEFVLAKTVATTMEKRVHWETGLEMLFEQMMEGLAALQDAVRMFPALKKVKLDDPKSYDVTIIWPDMFKVAPEERTATLTDLTTSIASGFLTQERATQEAAKVWGITDVSELLEELEETHDDLETVQDAAVDQAVNEAKAPLVKGNGSAK